MKTTNISIIIIAIMSLMLSCQENINDRASREAKEFTRKSCPTPVVDNTRTDSLTFDYKNRTLHYYYTLVGPADNSEAFAGRTEELHNALVASFRSSPGIRKYIESGINLKLTYRSEKNPQQLLFETMLTAEDILSK